MKLFFIPKCWRYFFIVCLPTLAPWVLVFFKGDVIVQEESKSSPTLGVGAGPARFLPIDKWVIEII